MAPSSQTIVKRGSQGVAKRGKDANETAVVNSTLRALQLRNGKGGSFGTGEIVRIPGREKLELIAEDEMQKAKEERMGILYEESVSSAVKAPFQLDTVLKIAQSQMDAYIDLVNALHSPDLCHGIVYAEIEAHCPPTDSGPNTAFLRVPSFVAEQFGICVHNAHMLASGWVILYESLRKLQEMGLRDREVRAQLSYDDSICDLYLSAYELLKKMVSALQQRLRSIVQNTPHYAPYFRNSGDLKGHQEFERSEIKRMYKSFLDSAIIELCLPGSRFSASALFFCLHATQEETPKLLRRCPQLMWDIVGDLSEAVRLLDIMEAPLINNESNLNRNEDTPICTEFARWDEAQPFSIKSVMDISSFVNLVNPLTNLQSKTTLTKVWDRLNANYLRASGQNIDELWQLADVRFRIPHFSILSVPSEPLDNGHQNGGSALIRADQKVQSGKSKRKRKEKPRARTADAEYDTDASVPPLVSSSENEYVAQELQSDEEDEYDEDEEADLKRLQRDAIDKSFEDPDVLDLTNENHAEERKKNPLLSLYGNLRGRLFLSSNVLRTDGETTLPSRPTKVPTAKNAPPQPINVQKSGDETTHGQTTKTAVEDVDDESDEHKKTTGQKKAKKKKKKKKSMNSDTKSLLPESPASPTAEPPRSPSPSPSVQPSSPLPTSPPPKPEKKSAQKSPSVKAQSSKSNLSVSTAYGGSTTTLPLSHAEKAASARSYLKEISEAKVKVKTHRKAAAEPPSESEKKERRNLFDRFRGKDRDVVKEDVKEKNATEIFGRLKRKTVTYARKLLGACAEDKKGSLKWDQFLQVMRELGFEYDPSTAGSSVRFDPPNPNDRSITFHKPHPDPTLHQYKLKEYRTKLEAYYGWSPEVFETALRGVGGPSDQDGD